ncbi:MAG TPA: efflux RND transporter periplasmic adaptor subunit [Thermoanaerobaculia bacterium]|nr:efflux RND transporter periplasmic adaptor subunit [Thermoanaerobaculia bacterium]
MDAEPRPRADLTALKIRRGDEDSERGAFALGKAIVWSACIAIAAVAVWAGYRQWVVPLRAPAVETMIVKPSINVANPALLTATGYLVADRQAKITPKISGKVLRLDFDTGMEVHRNDVLAVLESTVLQAQLDEANALLSQARRDFNRQAALWKEGIASRSVYDAAEAQLVSAKARAEQIRINMQDMMVRAPFDGTIATKNTEVGEVLSSAALGQVAGTLPSGAICTIVDLKTLKVVADVNESNIAQIREGQPAEVTVDAFPGQKWKGELTQIIPTADRAKAVVQVKVSILNPSARLLPEMSASVSFLQATRTDAELSEPPRIWLPAAAIVEGQVAVVDAQRRVAWKPVTTGITRDGRIEIKSGLREGERVVADKERPLKEAELVRLPEM